MSDGSMAFFRASGAAWDESADYLEKSGPEGSWVVDKPVRLWIINGCGGRTGWPLTNNCEKATEKLAV